MLRRDERPGHSLDEAARGKHAAGEPLPPLRLGQHRHRHAGRVRHRCGRHFVHAGEPHHLLDEICRAGDVGAPRRRGRLEVLTLALELDGERSKELLDLAWLEREPAQALYEAEVELEGAVRLWRLSGDRDFARLAAAKLKHQVSGKLEARHHKLWIDAALEAVARVRLDIEPAPRARRALRIEIGRLDEHIGRALCDAGLFAADYSAKPEHCA